MTDAIPAARFTLQSDALNEQGMFDPRYTCDIDNSSPELRWRDAPEGTRAFAVIFEAISLPGGAPLAMVDARERAVPAADAFAHWLVYNIPAAVLHLPAGIPPQDILPNGIRQGLNGLNKLGYTGPCPPKGGQARTYAIRVYALSDFVELPGRLNHQTLWQSIQPMILDRTEIVGRYKRVPQAQLDRERAG